ncbi:NlpC/P60 family protein [Jatrophihabitans telluris]|uniref:NlpC/P60 family protein n=1 Tax=Jatrophihabitans telluris TaxID=2038343 RepID=A0ABY4QVG5_9ACTN|nr:NlpC/P60 family protein [Jatrophihabitans telluris]UQX87242.1 NlpC/P60 family protein [Jatrophihabitans telluris]
MALTRKSRLSRVILGAVVLTGALLAGPLTAGAIPTLQTPAQPKTSADVLSVLDKLAKDNGKLTEQFNQARIDLTNAQKQSDAAAKSLALAQAEVAKDRQALATSLAAQYKGGSFSRTAALMDSASGQAYLDKMQSLSFLADHQKDVATAAVKATEAAKSAQAAADAAVQAAQKQSQTLLARRTTLESEIAKQKQLLATLTAAERAKLAARAAPSRTQLAAVTSVTSVTATGVARAPAAVAVSGSASSAALTAVRAALSQRGKPYVWGAGGPDSYDCSGLTMWAWGQAGVSLPHQSAEQQGMGTPVAQNNLQPGDLVFFGSPAYHVGMYIGNGMMVHAPTTGDVVKISSLAYMSDYSGAVRIG